MHGNNDSHSLETIKAALINEAAPYFADSGRQWFDDALESLRTTDQALDDLGLYSAMARRKLGEAGPEHSAIVATDSSPVDIRRWTSAESARLIFLISAVERDPDQAEDIVNAYYRNGDESERMALVRGLVFFAPAEYLNEIALDAGRTNNLELLSALALDNPYPACFYSDDQFNQMVLKALFTGLAIERVEGLARRANSDLARMGENYVIEREAAGRSVPVDIWLAIGPCASETGREQMIRYLGHDDIGHRYYCSRELIRLLPRDPSLLPVLRQRLELERQDTVRDLLRDALET
jgi:hypothetical protein